MKIDLITEITLLIERYPGKVSRHGLLFDDLTIKRLRQAHRFSRG